MKELESDMMGMAIKKGVSVEIVTLAKDNDLGQYRAMFVAEDETRSLKSYLYVPSEGLKEEDVCRIMVSLAVVYFTGGNIDSTRENLIAEAKESDTSKSTGKAAPKKSGAKAKPKAEPVTEEDGGAEETEAAPVETKKAAPKKTGATKAKAPKTIPYDRNKNEHKKELAKILNENFPGWQKDPQIATSAKAVSEELVGVAIFDNKGEVLPGFQESVLSMMAEDSEENAADL